MAAIRVVTGQQRVNGERCDVFVDAVEGVAVVTDAGDRDQLIEDVFAAGIEMGRAQAQLGAPPDSNVEVVDLNAMPTCPFLPDGRSRMEF